MTVVGDHDCLLESLQSGMVCDKHRATPGDFEPETS